MSDGEEIWADAMLVAALLAVDPLLRGVAVRARPGPVRDRWLEAFRALLPTGVPWRRLPIRIDDDRLLGGLDLAAALGGGRRDMQRGLLAEADGGVVVSAMSERLPVSLAARIGAVLDDGAVAIQREGFAERITTRFRFVALDEGVEEDEQPPVALLERLAFLLDLEPVSVRDAAPISATPSDIAAAQATLDRARPPETRDIEALCAAAQALGVESLRAPWLALRTAQALASLEGRDTIEESDLSMAARLVLSPRATRDLALQPEVANTPDDEVGEQPDEQSANDHDDVEAEVDAPEPSLNDMVLEAARAALPEELKAFWTPTAANASPSFGQAQGAGGAPLASTLRGRRIGSRPGPLRGASSLDVVETLKAAAPWQKVRSRLATRDAVPGLLIRREDFRVRRYQTRSESTVIFVVDASGSSAMNRLAETKGAVELLLAEAYVRRTQVALIAFRGLAPELLLPPTRSLSRARRCLSDLAGGGATPLAGALEAAGALAAAERVKGRTPLLVVLTDGRGNIALDGAAFRTRAQTDALAAAKRIGSARISAALIDTSARPRGDGASLADAMHGLFAALPYVEAGAVLDVTRALRTSAG
ncbi:magnesium chelatase subunit D [Brevundimonas sp. TWP2-3-4b2]|uniref:magnesium chelatase subunit D n=1 Tax=Brevundimonas sp. TWP2-3-4b2 TaxID=2804595 RepID=UPI003CEB7615